MRYQKSYTLSYALLILISLFAPEVYGVSLKYAFIPLVLMLLFGIVGKGISLRLKFKPHILICLCWVLVMAYSTRHSDVVGWSPNARSFCILAIAFALLYDIVPDDSCVKTVKRLYVYLTLFCALWIVLQAFRGMDRNNFRFITGKKDVNYLAAFMLPGIYMAMRFAFFEKEGSRNVYLCCIFFSFVALLFLQSRAAFITMLSIAFLCFCEYAMKGRLTKRKVAICILVAVLALAAIGFVWSNPAFSRLTSSESYEEDIRLEIWDLAMEAYYNSPIIGSGLGASNAYSQAGVKIDTHNNYIDILGDSGIVGMCLFLLLSWQILRAPKGERLHMFSFYVACMLPLGFINGFQTITFWLPLLMLAHEHMIIKRSAKYDRHDHLAS